MASPFFQFKQFAVWHDRCAMKVGTDGVLLGAWCPIPSLAKACAHTLDIGVGSGLITLMLAQRFQQQQQPFLIQAIDVDQDAIEQSAFNFQQSPWAQHLQAIHTPLQDFQPNMRYDLIVSNPPYFQNSLKNPDAARATARHTDSLSYNDLLFHASRLLADDGMIALVLPIEAEQEITTLAQQYKLMPTHITYVYPKPNKPIKRLLIAFTHSTPQPPTPITQYFHIESDTATRSEQYQDLTKAFYL